MFSKMKQKKKKKKKKEKEKKFIRTINAGVAKRYAFCLVTEIGVRAWLNAGFQGRLNYPILVWYFGVT